MITSNGVDITEMVEVLVDWLETIEEIELTEEDKALVAEAAESVTLSRNSAMERGILAEHFDDWFYMEVLECWSALMEDADDSWQPVQAFHAFIKGGEDRLYFQMLKRCLPEAQEQSA